MSNVSPFFPIHEPQHFSDYGFDPQIDYFKVLEEARKSRIRETSRSAIDLKHFKLQKPISRDDSSKKIKKKNSSSKRKRWWRNALLFFKFNKESPLPTTTAPDDDVGGRHRIGSISGPVYATESMSGSATPVTNTTSRRFFKGSELGIPYVNLREMNGPEQGYYRKSCGSGMPIYFVT